MCIRDSRNILGLGLLFILMSLPGSSHFYSADAHVLGSPLGDTTIASLPCQLGCHDSAEQHLLGKLGSLGAQAERWQQKDV